MIYIIAITAIFAWLALAAFNAPEGWQDRDGFHFGQQDDSSFHTKDNTDDRP